MTVPIPRLKAVVATVMIGGNDSTGRCQRIVDQIRIVGSRLCKSLRPIRLTSAEFSDGGLTESAAVNTVELSRKVDDMTEYRFDLSFTGSGSPAIAVSSSGQSQNREIKKRIRAKGFGTAK